MKNPTHCIWFLKKAYKKGLKKSSGFGGGGELQVHITQIFMCKISR